MNEEKVVIWTEIPRRHFRGLGNKQPFTYLIGGLNGRYKSLPKDGTHGNRFNDDTLNML